MSCAVKRVLVAGYGTMGRGVTLSFVRGGFETIVLSRNPSRIKDLPEGATAVSELPAEAPDMVLENVPEKVDVKHALYRRLEATYDGAPIIATNTSGLSLEELAAPLRHPEKFIGAHYLQPAEAFPLVEVIRIPATSDETTARTTDAMERTGKQVITVNRPVAGFLFNRLQHAMLHEAYWMIEQGIVTAEDVDTFARRAFGPRMCVTGVIEQKDLSGIDTHALSQLGIVPHLHHGAEPIRFVQDMYARGDLGAKTGKGFYDWTGRDVDAYKRKAAEKLKRILAIIEEE